GVYFASSAGYVHSWDEDAAVEQVDRVARSIGVDPIGITERLVMNAAELKALAQDPLAHFGAHTLTHVALARVDDERLRAEIIGSVDAVEAYVGMRPTTFAYPYCFPADAGKRELRVLKDQGIFTLTTQPGVLGC